ncbi:MAG: DUF4056 domain-containing protein [Solimonas sp.]
MAPTAVARDSYTISKPLKQPASLRPCCAFGYDLKVRALGIPIPFVRLNNVLDPTLLGNHGYDGGSTGFLGDLIGNDSEKLGIVYTRRGGFIDIAHVRDSADNALFLFTQIRPRIGEHWTLPLGPELAERRIEFFATELPESLADRYTLAANLAAYLSFQLAAWHEVAQWHGFHSVPGFSEEISAFSPEDLYSNVLGARLGLIIELQGEASGKHRFSDALTRMLPQALRALESVSVDETREMFDRVDGCWWSSEQRVPDKFLVLYRNYDIGGRRLPFQPDVETLPPQELAVPTHWHGVPLEHYAELRLYPRDGGMGKLPAPPARGWWTVADFAGLAQAAGRSDAAELHARNIAFANDKTTYSPPSSALCQIKPTAAPGGTGRKPRSDPRNTPRPQEP